MLVGHFNIALVSDVPELTLSELTPVAAALQTQVNRDFAPEWQRIATVAAFDRNKIPTGYWPIRVQADIGDPNAAGFHLDENNQPSALILYEPDWSVTASHELLEMILDPTGNWVTPGIVPGGPAYEVLVLRECCDACEDFTYSISNVKVSDYVKRWYYSEVSHPFATFDLKGLIKAPFSIAPNGYISWYDPTNKHWWQATDFGTFQVTDLGTFSKADGLSIREWIAKVSKS